MRETIPLIYHSYWDSVRRFTKTAFCFSLGAYVFLQAMAPNLELHFFWGEVFTLLLFCTTLKVECATKYQRRILTCVLIWIFIFPFYAFFYSYFFWQDSFVLYYGFRHLCFFYYAIFCLAGFRWGLEVLNSLKSLWRVLYFLFIFFAVFQTNQFSPGSVAGSMLVGFLWLLAVFSKNTKEVFWFGFVVFLLFHLRGMTFGERDTDKVVLAMLLLFVFLYVFRKAVLYKPNSIVAILLYRLLLIGFFLSGLYAVHFFYNSYLKFSAVGETLGILKEDFGIEGEYGILWRPMFWSYLIYRFWKNPMGIGIGTPLFEDELRNFILFPPKESEPFVIGAHNFFITYLTRMGIPVIVLFGVQFYAMYQIVRGCLKKMQLSFFDQKNRIVFISIIMFSTAFLQASFNVVAESPYTAGIFWFVIGLFVKVAGNFLVEAENREVSHAR